MNLFKRDAHSQKSVSKIFEDCLQRYKQFIRRDICRRHQKLPRDSSNKQMIVCKICKRNYMATDIGKKIEENMNQFQIKFKKVSFYINQLIQLINVKKQKQVGIYDELIKHINTCAIQYINSIKGLNQSSIIQQIKDEQKQDNYKCSLYFEAIQSFYKTYIDHVNELAKIYLKDIFTFLKDTCKIKIVQFFQKLQAIDIQASKKFRQQKNFQKKKSQSESNVLIIIPNQQQKIIKQRQQKIYNLELQNINLKKKLQLKQNKDNTQLITMNKSQQQEIQKMDRVIDILKIKNLESVIYQNNQSIQNYKKLLETSQLNQKQLNIRFQQKVNECEFIKKNHIQTIAALQNVNVNQRLKLQKIFRQNEQKLRIVKNQLSCMKKQKQEIQENNKQVKKQYNQLQLKNQQDVLKIQNLTKQKEKNSIQLCAANERLEQFKNQIQQNLKKMQILKRSLNKNEQLLVNAKQKSQQIQTQLRISKINNEQVKLKNIQLINKIQGLQKIVNQRSQNIQIKSNQVQQSKLKLQETEQCLIKVRKQSQLIQNQYNKKLTQQSTQNINKAHLLEEKLKQSKQNIKIKSNQIQRLKIQLKENQQSNNKIQSLQFRLKENSQSLHIQIQILQEKLKQNEQLLVKANKQSQQIQKQSQIIKLGNQQLCLKNIQHINKIQALQLSLKQRSQNLFLKTNQVQILKKKYTKQYTQNINNIEQLKEKLVQSNRCIEIKSVQAQRLNNKLKRIEQQLIDAKKQYGVLQQKFNISKQTLQNNIQRISFQKNQKQIALNKTIKKMENDSIEKKKSYEQKLYQIMEYQKIWTNLLNNSQIQTLFKMLRKRISFSRISLIFTASQHEFSSERFHRLCDNKSQLLVIGKCTNGKIFGGFCFPCFGNFEQNDCSFIFSITHKVDFNVKPGKKSTCLDLVYGPIFGSDSDFKIKERKVNTNYHIYKNSYEKIENFPISPKQVLCGETQAEILDYEVHKVILSDKI